MSIYVGIHICDLNPIIFKAGQKPFSEIGSPIVSSERSQLMAIYAVCKMSASPNDFQKTKKCLWKFKPKIFRHTEHLSTNILHTHL
jgi:hypothetical protein